MKSLFRPFRKRVSPMWLDIWPDVLTRSAEVQTLQLGCGMNRLPNATNVDFNPQAGAEVEWDLNKFPYPFKDDSFGLVVALSVLEHLDDFFSVMGEIHRISRNGASVYILVPHFSSAAAFVDPTHKSHFSARSCDYFVSGTDIEKDYGFYKPYRYELVRRYVDLQGWLNYLLPLRWLANKFPAFWENHLCYVFRGGGVFWEFKVVKDR